MACQRVVGSTCGNNGVCIISAENVSYCSCEDGWSQNLEWNFEAHGEDLSTTVCYFNRNMIRALYLILLTLCCIQTFVLMRDVTCKRQLRRRMVWIVLALCVVIMSLLRTAKPESGYSENYTYSLLFTVAIVIAVYQAIHYTVNYLKYVARKVEYLQGFKVEMATKIFQYLVLLANLNFAVCSVLVLFVSSLNNETKVNLFRFVMGVFTFLYFYETLLVFISLSEMITDMKVILDKSESMKSRNVFSGHGTEFEMKIRKSLPKTTAKRNKFAVLGTFLVACCLVPVLSPSWVLFLTYLCPIFLIIHYTFSIIHLLSKSRKKNGYTSSVSSGSINTNTNVRATSVQNAWRITGTNVSAISVASASENQD